MKFVIALAVLALLFTAGAQATSSEQPSWVDDEASSLAVSCGGVRATVIARMDYARVLHVDWADIVTNDPSQGETAGDVHWQRYWVDTYVQAIKLLRQDCSR